MRILFYVEPLVERENPTWKTYWVTYFVRKISTALISEGVTAEDIACLVPTSLQAIAREILPNSCVISIDHTELVPRFGNSALTVASTWYKNEASDKNLLNMGMLVKDRLGTFVPTCCISFSPAPFLKATWPAVHLLHMECGFISRPPFPETVYFDPYGMFSNSVLVHCAEELHQRIPSNEERALLENVRERFCTFGKEQPNPLSEIVSKTLEKFESAVLLALQFSNFYAYDANAQFTDQYDLLVHTLQSVPQQIAVVVCEHPEHPVLTPQTIAYLTECYPHFVWHPLFRQVYGASHYLMPFVQGVITVSSSVGLQALLWKKKLAVVGSSHLTPICDTSELAELPSLLREGWSEEKERVLCWLLSSFHLPFETLLESGRLSKYLGCLSQEGLSIFEEARDIAGLEIFTIRQSFDNAWHMRPLTPYGNAASSDRQHFFATLYVATEEHPYNEQQCLREFVNLQGEEEAHLKFILDRDNAKPLSVRFDPANCSCLLQLRELVLLDARNDLLWEWRGENDKIRSHQGVGIFSTGERGALLVCYDDDPQIELDIDFKLFTNAPQPLVISARLANPGVHAAEIYFTKLQHSLNQTVAERDVQLTEKDAQLAERDAQLAERDGQINALNQTLAERDGQISSVLNSHSWRLTAPLRSLRKKLIKNFYITNLE